MVATRKRSGRTPDKSEKKKSVAVASTPTLTSEMDPPESSSVQRKEVLEEESSSPAITDNTMSSGVAPRRWQLWVAVSVLYLAILLGIGKYSLTYLPETVVVLSEVDITEESSTKNPLKRIRQGAKKVNEFMIDLHLGLPAKVASTLKQLVKRPAKKSKAPGSYSFDKAFTTEPHLTMEHRQLLERLATDVHEEIPDIHDRAAHVYWGGPHGAPWWSPALKHVHHSKHSTLQQLDGGFLLGAYLKIMKWPPLLHTNFPFRLCKEGCDSAVAIAHTLEWREKYQPFKVSEAELEQNSEGWIYTRGLALASPKDPKYGRHAMIWARPSITRVKEPIAYVRCVINTADQAVAMSLRSSHGRVGKFNVVIDGNGYDWSSLPGLHAIQQTVTMLQDHFPDRLGVVFVVNTSRPAEFFINLVKKLITKDVREKIQVVSLHDEEKKLSMLQSIVRMEDIPDWLGGKDSWKFDVDSYEFYSKSFRFSKAESRAFLETMPYHDK